MKTEFQKKLKQLINPGVTMMDKKYCEDIRSNITKIVADSLLKAIGEDEKIPNYAGLAAAFGATEVIKEHEKRKEATENRNSLKAEIKYKVLEELGIKEK